MRRDFPSEEPDRRPGRAGKGPLAEAAPDAHTDRRPGPSAAHPPEPLSARFPAKPLPATPLTHRPDTHRPHPPPAAAPRARPRTARPGAALRGRTQPRRSPRRRRPHLLAARHAVATGRGRGGRQGGAAAAAQQQESGERRPVPPASPGAPAARLGGHLALRRVAMEAAPIVAAPANRRAGSTGEGGAEATGASDWARFTEGRGGMR